MVGIIIGEKFGKWTVIDNAPDRIDSNGRHYKRYLCKCECGEILEKDLSKLKGGAKMCKSCYLKVAHMNSKPFERKTNKYSLLENYGIGYASNTENAFYFDLEDYELIKDICWYENKLGYLFGYSHTDEKRVALHRLVLNAPDGMDVDHINRDVRDCRKCNLRICTQADNTKNKSTYKNNKSGKNGVCFDKRSQKWIAYIQCEKHHKYLGSFDSKEDAIARREEAEVKYYGEFAPL